MMYDQIAQYYDLTHADLTEDIPTILNLAQTVGSPVLELGCGSGRLLLPLARDGHTVTGVDNSAAMLARARARLKAESVAIQAQVSLVEADMASFVLSRENGRFPLAIIPYNTFLHLNTAQKTATLRQIKRYLKPNGSLFIDLINPIRIAATPDDKSFTLENQLTDPQTGDTILQFASNHLDEAVQTLHITWIYAPPSAKHAFGDPTLQTVVKAAYYYLFPHQIDLLFQDTGFKLKSLVGNYDQSSFHETSERLLITAAPTS